MGNLKFPITTIDGCKFQLDIDLDLYVADAIDATAYKFTGMCYVFQQKDKLNEKIVHVIFEAKDGKDIDDSIIKQFCNELMDQQVRYNVNKQFGKIRDMIVEEAFKPIS